MLILRDAIFQFSESKIFVSSEKLTKLIDFYAKFLFGWLLVRVFDIIYFCAVFKVFWCISFRYVYPDTCSCILSIIRIHFKILEQISKWDFSYPDCIIWSGFGIFKQNWYGWTVCDSIQYYQKKGRRQFTLLKHSLEFYNFLVCCLRFLVESIPKQKLLKGLPVLPLKP